MARDQPSVSFHIFHISWVTLAGILPGFHGVLPDRLPGDFGAESASHHSPKASSMRVAFNPKNGRIVNLKSRMNFWQIMAGYRRQHLAVDESWRRANGAPGCPDQPHAHQKKQHAVRQVEHVEQELMGIAGENVMNTQNLMINQPFKKIKQPAPAEHRTQ